MRLLIGSALLAAFVITGCTTMTPEERRAIDSQTCSSYGFKRGGDGFASCLLNLELDRRAASRAQFDEMRFNNPPIIFYGNRYHRRWR
ncbi:hypothetical protein QFZ34_003759 [Phyllobacterium ifriqiyense]|uniref:Lipoprotein n=1 Tax=Phyllobacterium ifriqiyense TaxID=314238 RepID=A0ABU0SCU1_9HYPH|nr:hypothetical protein [Phyllobacterium ifriqiyense]MDQ0998577.1 hypothetical protein [Phyllobacterium ifriqiyense]